MYTFVICFFLFYLKNQQDPPLNGYARVLINLLDQNVERPQFVGIAENNKNNYIELAVLENKPQGTIVGTIVALDGDVLTPRFSLVITN